MLRLLVALAAVAFLLAVPAGRAGAARDTGPAPPPVVRAGETIELCWDVSDPAIEELELELSMDGGPWIRISPELPGLTRRYVWRVPDAAAERARVRLRVGTEFGERDLEPGAPFRIEPASADLAPPAVGALHVAAPSPSTLAGSPPSLSARADAEPAEGPARHDAVLPPAWSAGPKHGFAPGRPLGQPAARPRESTRYPLRN